MTTAPFDLVIRGGTVVDGTGTPGVRADVAVREGRIAAVGAVDGHAARVIEAAGLVVCPGFVDVHAHDDGAVLSTPMDFKLMQGVTTDVVGNCGAGIAPKNPERPPLPGLRNILGDLPDADWPQFGDYMKAIEEARPGVNVACLAPHGAVRYATMGLENRAPTDDELEAMRAYVDEAMAAGAVGLSTGLIYPPGAFAETAEIIELAKVAARHGSIYVSHIRNESERLLEAVEEALTIGREAGLPMQISHHKAAVPEVWGQTADSLKMIDDSRAAGQDVTMDVYPYVAGSTVLSAMTAIAREPGPRMVLVASVAGHPEWEGRYIDEIAEEMDMPARETAFQIVREDPGAVGIFFGMHWDDVKRVVSHEQTMIGSDGIPSMTGKPHPRLYGTFARVLQKYAREEAVLSLEECVRKMTSLPARRFGLAERGEVREDWHADLVVLDPARVEDVATYEQPRQYPAGIEYVIVNGTVAAENGKQVETHAGRLVRRGVA
jgi:N-acyl-D-amino-acid deacylase